MLQNVHPSCKELQILLFFSNNFNVLQTNELDNSEQVAADLIDLLKQSAPASPFCSFENNQYNALQMLAEIFKVSLDYTSIEHQLLATTKQTTAQQQSAQNHSSPVPRVLIPVSISLQTVHTSTPISSKGEYTAISALPLMWVLGTDT